MGIIRLSDVTEVGEAARLDEQRSICDPDTAGPIGRRAPRPSEHSATLIAKDASGEIVYGPEIPMEIYKGNEKLLPVELQGKLGLREIRGWLFQVRADENATAFQTLKGKAILLSKLPHSRNYFLLRRLKTCKYEKSIWRRVADAWDDCSDIPLVDERLDRILEDAAFTPFVSHKRCQACWAISARRFNVLGSERADTEDDYSVAALDLPIEEACELLRTHPAIQRALDRTDDGTLFENYQRPDEVKLAVGIGLKPPKGPLFRRVSEQLYERRLELLEAACWAALSGRETVTVSESVSRSTVLMYHRFAYDFLRREVNPEPRPMRRNQFPASAVSDLVCQAAEFSEQEQIREWTSRWREIGYVEALTKITAVIDGVLQQESVNQRYVEYIRPALAAWPTNWKRPSRLAEALSKLSDG